MTHSRFHNLASVLLLSLTTLLGGCATGGASGDPTSSKESSKKESSKEPSTQTWQSATPERKEKKSPAASSKKPNLNRVPADETSGPPAPAKPPAIGGSGG